MSKFYFEKLCKFITLIGVEILMSVLGYMYLTENLGWSVIGSIFAMIGLNVFYLFIAGVLYFRGNSY